MIVACPACQTRYLVDDAVLGGDAGRRVRCASCGNLWLYSPDAAVIQAAMAEATAQEPAVALSPTALAAPVAPALRAEPGTQLQPHPAGPTALARPSVAVELPAPTPALPRRSAGVGGLGLILLAAALVLFAILAREPILAMWPSTTRVYALLGLTQQPGGGLNITATQTQTPDSLIVAGDIVNTGAEQRQVPRLRITLRDGTQSVLVSKIVDPPVGRLPPGATAHFTTTFEHPSVTEVTADVSFAQD